MRKFKLNRVDAWIIQSKHAVEDNYLSSLKSMSMTISPFLIILTMTHKMEFVSSATSMFVTWDVNWILVTATSFLQSRHGLEKYIYLYNTCEMTRFQCWWIMNVQAPWVLQCFLFSCGNSPKGCNDIWCPIFSTIQQNRGNPIKASHN